MIENTEMKIFIMCRPIIMYKRRNGQTIIIIIIYYIMQKEILLTN